MSSKFLTTKPLTPAAYRVTAAVSSGALPQVSSALGKGAPGQSRLIAVPFDESVQILNTNPPFFSVVGEELGFELHTMFMNTYGYVVPATAAVSGGSATTAIAAAAGQSARYLGFLCSIQSGKLDPDANTGNIAITLYQPTYNADNVNDKYGQAGAGISGASDVVPSTVTARFQYSKDQPLIRFAVFAARQNPNSGLIVPDYAIMRSAAVLPVGGVTPAAANASGSWTGLPGTTSAVSFEGICKDSPNRDLFTSLFAHVS